MTPETHEGGCHCGAVRFRATLPEGLASARRCNCSFCAMRGAVAVTARADGFELREGAGNLTLYRFGTGAARHHFCSICGIHTHHQRRSNPAELGVNLACLDGLSPFDLPEVPVLDGAHHPSDGGPGGAIGHLQFMPETR